MHRNLETTKYVPPTDQIYQTKSLKLVFQGSSNPESFHITVAGCHFTDCKFYC